MPLNADQLLAVFLQPVLTKIIGEPNLASIMLQQSEHNGNLASIKSNLGDRLTGLMVLSMIPGSTPQAPFDTLLLPWRLILGTTQDSSVRHAPSPSTDNSEADARP